MKIVKIRKERKSIVLAIPKSFDSKEGQGFFLIEKDSKSIIMVPKIKNPFEHAKDGELYTPDLNVDVIPFDRELDRV
ncbi:MAG: hypothetical protein KC455_01850 [Carnobacterium sp.]|nr:hypothetical protein [Carnobacterium sp.]